MLCFKLWLMPILFLTIIVQEKTNSKKVGQIEYPWTLKDFILAVSNQTFLLTISSIY